MGNIIRMLNNRTPKSIRYRNKKRSEKFLRSKSSRKMVDRKIKSNAIEKILQQEFEKEVKSFSITACRILDADIPDAPSASGSLSPADIIFIFSKL